MRDIKTVEADSDTDLPIVALLINKKKFVFNQLNAASLWKTKKIVIITCVGFLTVWKKFFVVVVITVKKVNLIFKLKKGYVWLVYDVRSFLFESYCSDHWNSK